MKRFVLTTLTLCLAAGIVHAGMSIKVDEATQRYTIQEGGQPVLTYNFGAVPVPEGVSGKYAVARSNYVHPLYGPGGEILTEDFTKDHPHHRGIYWAWPEVTYKGATRDLHALQGVFARPVKILKQSADQNSAVITAENVWKWDDTEEIVREFATITAYPANKGLRIIDFQFKFEALKESITLARRGKKAYGGFNFRMSKFTDLKINKHSDAPGTYPCKAWAELSGTPPEGKETIGIFLLQNPANPLYPGDWVEFPVLPWLQPTFPAADMAYELKQDTPLELSFRVIVRCGEGLKASPEALFDAYAGKMADPLSGMAGYVYGTDRTLLTATEQAIRDQPIPERARSEQRLLAILTAGETSPDFQRWAFRQLQLCGSAACLPVASAHLAKESWLQALDAIAAVPGQAGTKTLLDALRTLPVEKSAAVIQTLGMRRDEAALPALTVYAAGSEPLTAAASIAALGNLGSSAAANALAALKVAPALQAQLIDARLDCADALPPESSASETYRSIWNSGAAASSPQRAAALVGLARCSQVTTSEITAALTSTEPPIQNGAAAALRYLTTEALLALRTEFDKLPQSAKLAVMTVWCDKKIKESEPVILSQLENTTPELQLTATRALRTTGGEASVLPLLALATAGGAAGNEAKITLAQLNGAGVFEALAKATANQDAKLAQAALKAINERADPGARELMMELAHSPIPAVATPALDTLRNSGTAEQLPALRKILVEGDIAVKTSAAGAMVLICKREPAAPIAAVLGGTPELTGDARNAMLSALPEIGGEAALAFVGKSKDEPAIRALLNWPESSAIAPMLALVADKTIDDKLNRLAASGLLRLVKKTAPVSEQVLALKAALPSVRDAELRKQIGEYVSELATVNLALGKPVTSSHPCQGDLKPELAVDGKLNTFWSCAFSPAWISVDLGAIETLSRIKVVNFFGDGRYYQYVVEVSIDNQSWQKVADMSGNTEPATEQGVSFKLDVIKARYVRVTMLKNSANPGMHIRELEAYGILDL